MNPLYTIKGLSINRGNPDPVLRIDSLEIMPGETLTIIGPNGAGKSTLLLALAKLLPLEQGEITFEGSQLDTLSATEYRRKIAIVMQSSLLLDKTVYQNVATGLQYCHLPRKIIKARVNHWLERFSIAHLKERRANQLSGGEAQRVSLARAFALEPEIILLDEPFSALDAQTRTQLIDDFHHILSVEALTVVLITHDLNEALLLSDRVGVVLNGVLRQVGPAEEVFSCPTDPEVAAFVGIETVIPGKVIQEENGLLTIAARDHLLQAIGEVNIGQKVLACLRPEDVTLWTGQPTPESSARNNIQGTISRMLPQGALIKIVVDCGYPVTALITRRSAQDLDLQISSQVCVRFKASTIHLIPRF